MVFFFIEYLNIKKGPSHFKTAKILKQWLTEGPIELFFLHEFSAELLVLGSAGDIVKDQI